MVTNELKEKLEAAAPGHVALSEEMKAHVTFRVGGPADYFVTPGSYQEAAQVLKVCEAENVPYYILGNGSNLLVGDKGFRGVIIQLQKGMNGIETEGKTIRAQAGALLSQVAAEALHQGLTGFEFAAGIPGTLGGACIMNAGAYGGEIKDVLKEVTVLDAKREILVLDATKLDMKYRHSELANKGYIVLEAVLELKEGKREEIQAIMDDLKRRRIEKQPLEYPSAGSTFKRPEGYFAGKLIQDTGLRGFTVGGAQVSEKHCGFVINKDNATAADIAELMRQVSEKVKEKFGVELEPEVKRIGEF